MSIRPAVLAALFVPLIASSGAAQLLSSPLSFTVSAGTAIPIGDTSDALNTGYSIGGAADLRVPLVPIGARLEGTYASFGAKGLSGTGITSRGSDLGANFNAVLWIPTAVPLPLHPYLTAGPSYSRLKLNASQGGGTLSTTQDHWGFNAGGGMDVWLGLVTLRVDARYKRISTDNDTFQSVPVTLGIKF
jgi:hypothetical protein